MTAIFLVLGASLGAAIMFLFAYLWSVKTGQFDDDYSPAIRILYEDNKDLVSESIGLFKENPLLLTEGEQSPSDSETNKNVPQLFCNYLKTNKLI